MPKARMDKSSAQPKAIEIKKATTTLENAPRSKLLQALIYLNKAEEKRSLENFVDGNAIIKTR